MLTPQNSRALGDGGSGPFHARQLPASWSQPALRPPRTLPSAQDRCVDRPAGISKGAKGEEPWGGSGTGYCLLLSVSEKVGREGLGQRRGGRAPSDPGAPAVSEPNLKLRYKPKKSLERRKNPLLRKESAPPSLRRRPAETLGGEARQGGWVGQAWCPPPGLRWVVVTGWPTHLPGGELGQNPAPAPLANLTSAQKKGHLKKTKCSEVLEAGDGLPVLLGRKQEAEPTHRGRGLFLAPS